MTDLDDHLRGIPTARLLELTAQIAGESDPDDELRWAYVRELHGRPQPAVFEGAAAWCADPRDHLRVLGADLLGQLGYRERQRPRGRDSQRQLAAMIDDDEPEVVAAAITALSHFSRNHQQPRVIAAADHAEAEVRRAVAVTLGGEQSPEAVAALIALSRDVDEEVRNWATFGLGSQCDVDTPEVRQALADRLEEQDDEIRGEALVGLARRADGRALEALEQELGREAVSSLAVDAAATMPSPRLLPHLEALLARHPDDPPLAEAARRCHEADERG